MCIAVPLRILRIVDSTRAVAGDEAIEIGIDISLVPEAKPGDYVIVHAGFAIQVLRDEDAAERLDLFREIAPADAET